MKPKHNHDLDGYVSKDYIKDAEMTHRKLVKLSESARDDNESRMLNCMREAKKELGLAYSPTRQEYEHAYRLRRKASQLVPA
jgi:hypothetical protein